MRIAHRRRSPSPAVAVVIVGPPSSTPRPTMAPNIREPLAYAGGGGGNEGPTHDVVSRIYLIRHGDRFDYA